MHLTEAPGVPRFALTVDAQSRVRCARKELLEPGVTGEDEPPQMTLAAPPGLNRISADAAALTRSGGHPVGRHRVGLHAAGRTPPTGPPTRREAATRGSTGRRGRVRGCQDSAALRRAPGAVVVSGAPTGARCCRMVSPRPPRTKHVTAAGGLDDETDVVAGRRRGGQAKRTGGRGRWTP